MSKGLMSDNSRYTKQFRMGKWVDRLLQYSEDISKKYDVEAQTEELNAREEKMKPFSEIDF